MVNKMRFCLPITLFICVFILSACDLLEKNPPNDSLKMIWDKEYGSYDWSVYAPPAVLHDSLLLYAGDGNIHCVRVNSGEIKWTSTYPSPGFMHEQFVFDESNLYGFSGSSTVFGLNLEDGSSAWETGLDWNRGFGYRTTTDGESYFIGSIRLDDSKTIWKLNKDGMITDSLGVHHFPGLLAVNGTKLYSGTAWYHGSNLFGSITCFSKDNLDTLWEYSTEQGGFAEANLLQEEQILYAGTIDGGANGSEVVALNTETGEKIWSTSSYGCYQIIIHDNILFYTGAASVNTLDKTTGQVIWRTTLPTTDQTSPFAYWDGYVYKAHGGTLYVINANTGEIVHSTQGPDAGYVFQVSAGAGKIFIQSGQHLYALAPYSPSLESIEKR